MRLDAVAVAPWSRRVADVKVKPDCFPCLLRRALIAARQVTDDEWLQHKVLAKAMEELSSSEREVSPAEVMCHLSSVVGKILGSTDIYQKQRDEWASELENIASTVSEVVESSADPLETAFCVAARANVFDDERLSGAKVRDEINSIGLKAGSNECSDRLAVSDYQRFRKELEEANSLLFLHDSGPELFFDRFLFEQLSQARPELKIYSVVRSQPILLDAIALDRESSGLGELPQVEEIDLGLHALGAPLNECPRDFRDVFEAADLVIAKGQAHFETLFSSDRRIYYLMRVKCQVMAREQGAKIGETLFFRSS